MKRIRKPDDAVALIGRGGEVIPVERRTPGNAEGTVTSARMADDDSVDDDFGSTIWSGLRCGRNVLVREEETHEVSRYLVFENAPSARTARGWTHSENRILRLLIEGCSSKDVAGRLRITQPTVSRLSAEAVRKAGLASMYELIRIGRRLLGEAPVDRGVFSESEVAILRLVGEGRSNWEIAMSRGTSPRTVANQVAALLRKTRARSRRALWM